MQFLVVKINFTDENKTITRLKYNLKSQLTWIVRYTLT